ncbi:hypothetical protein DV735_g153, partial [Chaetothyriales sp. CBS 134920]
MDSAENSEWLIHTADWIDRFLTFWHDHRLLAFAVVVCLSLTTHVLVRRREEVDGVAVPSPPCSAVEKGVVDAVPDDKRVAPARTIPAQTASKARPVKVVTGRRPDKKLTARSSSSPTDLKLRPFVFYVSLTGTSERLAKHVAAQLRRLGSASSSSSRVLEPELLDLSYIDLDDYFISGPKAPGSSDNEPTAWPFYAIVIPSYDIDTILNNFLAHLDETHNDFRIDTSPLSTIAGYSVFGVGDQEGWPSEQQAFCYQAIEVDKWLAKLTGRKRAYPLGMGNTKGDLDKSLDEWINGLSDAINDIVATGTLGEGVPGSGNAVESEDEEEAEEAEFPDGGRRKRQKTSLSTDLEDVGGAKKVTAKGGAPLATDWTGAYSSRTATASASAPAPAAPLKAMVPKESPTYTALTKQGYTIVGSHSGVKICRWTKSALRGRGSCYKNSFYGIASHLCMETTPALSCSNKCVFCWRHGTNPVSTTWRWQVDDPRLIFEGAKEGHYKKIKMMRGVPGVRSERFQDAMRIRHCALSLVGEPIFYPRINEFVSLLHGERISSFLVCNAQHPQQLESLQRVTQLYVSIDASNRDSLRKIDRPLHRDFWERFNTCLDIVREKRFVQRTVFRLTLVKGFNVEDEAEGYADLVAKALPCFIEVKGVTYCGTSTATGAGLTMQNVPFYDEVVQFVQALNDALDRRGLGYGIAAEHAHSCCILLASNRFHIGGRWHTVIDYDRFFALLEAGQDFGPEDYCKATPEWALWGKGGFDPRDERVDRKGRKKE